MKERVLHNFCKKTMTGILVALFVFCAMGLLGMGQSKVQAAAGDVTMSENEVFVAVEYNANGLSELRKSNSNIAPEYEEGWIFAGWYKDAKCEEIFRDVTATSTQAFAKFVPLNVLSVKCQVNKDITATSGETETNMRLVSSVDSLNYLDVGFVIEYTDIDNTTKNPITHSTKEVYKRIKANAESGVEYEFSPKVIDTKSEYFITATLVGIDKGNYGNTFLVKAFWKTYDGTVVYGPARYVTVADSYSDVVSIPVKASAVGSSDELSATVGTVSADSVAYRHFTIGQSEEYANLIVDAKNIGLNTLPSATKVTVSDTEKTIEESVIYRNYYTTYTQADGTTKKDTSWYDINTDTKEFVIATDADLWGFASVVNGGETFENDSIILVRDVVASEGKVDVLNGTWSGTSVWEQIAKPKSNNAYYEFNGTFDGDGNTISGIYIRNSYDRSGLFGYVGANGVIKNFKLTNSFIEHTSNGWYFGSVAGILNGNMENVYASDTVLIKGAASTKFFGGLVGRYTGTGKSIKNCWFNGTLDAALCVGGITGEVNGTVTLENCLNSGKIVSSHTVEAKVGGLIGDVANNQSVIVKDCLSIGNITSSTTKTVGPVIGQAHSGSTVTIDNVYAVDNRKNTQDVEFEGTTDGFGSTTGATIVDGIVPIIKKENELRGYDVYFNTTLVDNENWVARVNDTPAIKMFVSHADSMECDFDWYYNGTSPYKIADKEDLYGMMALVNSGKDTFQGDTIQLIRDIKINNGKASDWANGVGVSDLRKWIPVGANETGKKFAAEFDGQGHTISGVYVSVAQENVGLFSFTFQDAVIKNLQLSESYIHNTDTGHGYTGAVVGTLYGSVMNVYCDDSVYVKGEYNNLGGIVGYFAGDYTREISNCWFAGTATGAGTRNGGIVGRIYNGQKTLENCLFTGTIEGSNQTGGLAGTIEYNSQSTIRNSLSTGTIKGSDTTKGSIVGLASKHATYPISVTLENVYTNNGTLVALGGSSIVAGSTIKGKEMVVTDSELTDIASYENLAFDFYDKNDNADGVWAATENGKPELKQFSTATLIEDLSTTHQVTTAWYYNEFDNLDAEGNTTNTMSAGTEFTLMTAGDLYGLEKIVENSVDIFTGKIVRLGTDIVINEGTASLEAWTAEEGETVHAWTGIGVNATNKKFNGTFDGSDKEGKIHSISGIVADGKTDNTALFGWLDNNGTIQNLIMANSYFAGEDNSGALVGKLCGDIKNIYVTDSVYIYCNNGASVGGLVGIIDHEGLSGDAVKSTIENCWFAGTVKTTSNRCGAIAGRVYLMSDVTVNNCLNTGTVIGNQKIGGIIGSIVANTTAAKNNTVSIKNCINAGTVTASSLGGHIFGDAQYSNGITLENVYGVAPDDTLKTYGLTNSVTINGIAVIFTEDELKGEKAYANTDLDFASKENPNGVWRAIADKKPALAIFATEGIDTFTTQKTTLSWYYNQYVNNAKVDVASYEIESTGDMLGLAKIVNSNIDYFDKDTVTLTQSIDFNPGWDATKRLAPTNGVEWPGIGTNDTKGFNGTFDGNDNTIRGVYMNVIKDTASLFKHVGATGIIRNLNMDNCLYQDLSPINGNGWATAGVVARMYGSMDKVYASPSVIVDGAEMRCGGLVARYYGEGSITNCWFAGEVTGTQSTGGILGNLQGTSLTIENCYVSGNVTCILNDANQNVGGLVGQIEAGTLTINQCLVTGSVTANRTTKAAMIIGSPTGTPTITDTYAISNLAHTDGITEVPAANNLGTIVTREQLNGFAASIHTNLDFEGTETTAPGWVLQDGSAPIPAVFGESTVEVDTSWYNEENITYTLSDLGDLYGFVKLSQTNNFAGKTVKLDDNITEIKVNDGDASKWADGKDTESLNAWIPIGKNANGSRFSGTFDGNGKTISGLYMNQEATHMGLFPATEYGSTVKNLRITNSYFKQTGTNGAGYVGSVAGDVRGTLDGIYSDAILETTKNYIGGLTASVNAYNYEDKTYNSLDIKNCWFDGDIRMKESSTYGGGIFGVLNAQAQVSNCLFTGTIDSKYSDATAISRVGGIVGQMQADTNLTISSCISAGTITDANAGKGVGSIVGRITKTFSEIYAEDGETVTGYNAKSSYLTLKNVFASRDCCAQTVADVSANSSATVGGVTYEAKVVVTGTAVMTHGKDHLIGYCTENSGESLDFENAWVVREGGVPVPKSFADMVTVTNANAIDAALGLDTLGVAITSAVNKGMGNYVISKTSVDDATYEAYKATLVSLGFTEYVNNSSQATEVTSTAADGVYNVIYVKGDWVLSIVYVANTDTLDISISTAGIESLSTALKYIAGDSKTDYAATGTVNLTMVQLSNDDNELNPGNSFVFQLPNGHFIINDGGYSYNFAQLKDCLESKVSEDEKIYVDAWIISHLHADHSGVFSTLMDNPDFCNRLFVDAVYVSEPNKQTLAIEASLAKQIEKEYLNIAKCCKKEDGTQTDFYRFQTGQRYFFNGMIMDVVQTQDQLSLNANGLFDGVIACEGQFNSTSTTLLYRMSNGDTLYLGGDATTTNDNYIKAAYGTTSNFLKEIDVYVALHHGLNSKLDYCKYLLNGSSKFKVVLFPAAKKYSEWTRTSVAEGVDNYTLAYQYAENNYDYKSGNIELQFTK